jgi:hypothetical protein
MDKKYPIALTMNIRTDDDNIWIALAKVKSSASDNKLGPSGCAYVSVVGLAKTKLGFKRSVVEMLSRLNFKLLVLDDVEKLNERVKKFEVDTRLLELANGLSHDENVKFSTFHSYD